MGNGIYIKDLPSKYYLDGSESVLIQDDEGTKQASLDTIANEVKKTAQSGLTNLEIEITQTNMKVSQKANTNEVVIKGKGTLDDFNEETRSAILGMEPGTVNAVLGDRNVTKDNLKLNIVDGDILAKEYNMFNFIDATNGYTIIGENPETKDIDIGENPNNSVYKLQIPNKGVLRISVINPLNGQFIVYMKDEKVVARATYDQAIRGSVVGTLKHSPINYDSTTNELYLYCERLSQTVDSIYLNILNSEADNYYIKGQNVFSLQELEWLEPVKINTDIAFNNIMNTELNNDNLLMRNTLMSGYDLTTLKPIFRLEFGYLVFSLDAEKYKNSIITIGGVSNISTYSGQRLIYLDNNGNTLKHIPFVNTSDTHEVDMIRAYHRYPTLSTILIACPYNDINNTCNGYISVKDVSDPVIIFTNVLNTELNNEIMLEKNSRIVGYHTDTLEPNIVDDEGYLIFKVDSEKYKHSILTIGGIENISEHDGQRLLLLDDKGKMIIHITFTTPDVYEINVAYFYSRYPNLTTILVSFPYDSVNNTCTGYMYSTSLDSSQNQSLNNLKYCYEDLWDINSIQHRKRITAYDIPTGSIVTAESDSYFYMIIDAPKKGMLEIPIAQDLSAQLLILIDEDDIAFTNFYGPSILKNGSTGTVTYNIGDNYFTFNCETCSPRTSKLAISFRYDYPEYYIKGIKTFPINDILGLEDITYSTKHEIILPKKFVIVEGVESSIYFNNVVRYADTDKIGNVVVSGCDSATNRYARYKRSATGNVSCGINLQSLESGSTYLSKSINGLCIPKDSGNGLNKKVLFIGDSLTDATTYAREIVNLFSTDVMNVELLGTRGNGDAKHEGRSGWRAWEYVNLPTGEYGYLGDNAFYNESTQKFDFTYYMDTQGYSDVDYVFINLGTNDIGRSHHNTDNDIIESYNFIIDSIKAFDTNVKILLWLPPTRALGMIGTRKANIDTALRANQLIINTYDNRENENIFLVPVYFNIDPYHDYRYETINVSDRNSKFTELKCLDLVHPATEGYYKIADVIYAWIKYMAYLETNQ